MSIPWIQKQKPVQAIGSPWTQSNLIWPCNRPQKLTVQPTDYAKLYNPCNPRLKKLEDINSQQKKRFAVRVYKVYLGSDTPQNYQQALSSLEKFHWIEAMEEEFD